MALLAGFDAPAYGQAQPAPARAVEQVPADWTVLHCGVASGILYLTYAEGGRAAIAPAVDNAAIRAACAGAGYPLGRGPAVRGAQPPMATDLPPLRPPAPGRQSPSPVARPPEFTAQAAGSNLSVDGRNDGDLPQSCLVSFAWTWDDNPGAPRASTVQVTLPGRQSNRVANLNVPGSGARFVSPPSTVCRPLP